MIVSELITRARKFTSDDTLPYDLGDEYYLTYLSEACRELCVAGRLLRKVLTFPVKADDRYVDLGEFPLIMEFRKAFLIDASNTRYPMKLRGTVEPAITTAQVSDYGLFRSTTDDINPSRPKELIFGTEYNNFILSPPSDGTYTIEASVIAYPDEFTSITDEPEIASRYHHYLSLGCAVKCLDLTDFYNINNQKYERLSMAWQKALIVVAQENNIISRDAGPVAFSNDFWG